MDLFPKTPRQSGLTIVDKAHPWSVLPALAPSAAQVDSALRAFPVTGRITTAVDPGKDRSPPPDVRRSMDMLAQVRLTLVKIRLRQFVSPVELLKSLDMILQCAKRYDSRMADGYIRLDSARRVLEQATTHPAVRLDWCIDAVRCVHDEIRMLDMLPNHQKEGSDRREN